MRSGSRWDMARNAHSAGFQLFNIDCQPGFVSAGVHREEVPGCELLDLPDGVSPEWEEAEVDRHIEAVQVFDVCPEIGTHRPVGAVSMVS